MKRIHLKNLCTQVIFYDYNLFVLILLFIIITSTLKYNSLDALVKYPVYIFFNKTKNIDNQLNHLMMVHQS